MNLELKTKRHNPDVVEFKVRYSNQPFWIWVPLDFFAPTILFISLILIGYQSMLFWALVSILIVIRIWLRRTIIVEETLTVIRGLGIQVGTKFKNGSSTQTFIEKKRVKNLIINEGVKSYQVIFYLAFLIEGDEKMTLAFPVCL